MKNFTPISVEDFVNPDGNIVTQLTRNEVEGQVKTLHIAVNERSDSFFFIVESTIKEESTVKATLTIENAVNIYNAL